MPPERWQARGIRYLSRKSVPVSDHPYSTEMLSNVQSEPLVQLCAIPMHVLSLVTREKRPAPPSALPSPGSCREQWGCFLASSSPDWTTQVSSASPCRTCLPALVPIIVKVVFILYGRFHDNIKYSTLQNYEKSTWSILLSSHLRILSQPWRIQCLETAASLKQCWLKNYWWKELG